MAVWISFPAFCKPNDLRIVKLLDYGWRFINKEVAGGEKPGLITSDWQTVEVPHDWAIAGPFNEENDAQIIQVMENGKQVMKKRLGSTGGLPHVGIGWYRRMLDVPSTWKGKTVSIEFDGAMSHAQVYLNGHYIGEWPYGYASFGFDLTDKIIFGKENLLAVRLENKPQSSRWYPGAGIYRNVRLVVTSPVHVKQWGTYLITPDIEQGKGTVNIETSLEGFQSVSQNIKLTTNVYNSNNKVVATVINLVEGNKIMQKLLVDRPQLWSVANPYQYRAESVVSINGKPVDRYETMFGFRYFKFTSNDGFSLNGEKMKLNGVCMHHDLGAIGAAINVSALKRQLTILKEMGCNAIRTSHNPPASELLELTDIMGFLVFNEAFDEWKIGKCTNGYNTLWDKWAEKDLVAFIHRDRNHPSVIAWSIGNEIKEQKQEDGASYCKFLVDICHHEDPTRPVTGGFQNREESIKNGMASVLDVVGWNYHPLQYQNIHKRFPAWAMIGSETSSALSSRGEYFFPAEFNVLNTKERKPYQCSSYDLDIRDPYYNSPPDLELAHQDSCPFIAGQFVWTGFDYLGEPSPFDNMWPSRSSYFGIVDLAGIPKDRYYMYQSQWSNKDVLHLLPHWNWEGMEGKPIPVHCYTSYQKAELFVNGKSMGIREKDPDHLYSKYRLIWNDVPYEPGELKVVALDSNSRPIKEIIIKTAGKPASIVLTPDRMSVSNSEKELAFVTVSIVDKNGVLCPRANNKITFSVTGAGKLRAADNGDPTCLESFIDPVRSAFNGKCLAIIQSVVNKGEIKLVAQSQGLESAEQVIKVVKKLIN